MSLAYSAFESPSSSSPAPDARLSVSRQAFLTFNLLAVRNLFDGSAVRLTSSSSASEKSTLSGGGSKAGIVWGALFLKNRKNFKHLKDSPSLLLESLESQTQSEWTTQTGLWNLNTGDSKAVRIAIFVQFSDTPTVKHEVGALTLTLPLVANTQQPHWEPLELAPGLKESNGAFNSSGKSPDECPAILFTACFFDRSGSAATLSSPIAERYPESPARSRLSMLGGGGSKPGTPLFPSLSSPAPLPPNSSSSSNNSSNSNSSLPPLVAGMTSSSSSSSLSTTAAEMVRFRRELGVADEVECRGAFKVKLVNAVGKQQGDLVIFGTSLGFLPESARAKSKFLMPLSSIVAIDMAKGYHVRPRIKIRQVDGSSFKVVAVKHLPKLVFERLDSLWRETLAPGMSLRETSEPRTSRDTGSLDGADTDDDASESFSSDDDGGEGDGGDNNGEGDLAGQKSGHVSSLLASSSASMTGPVATGLSEMRATAKTLPLPSCPAFDTPYSIDEIASLIYPDEHRDLYLKRLVEAFGLSSPLTISEWRPESLDARTRDVAFTKASGGDGLLPSGSYEINEAYSGSAGMLKIEMLITKLGSDKSCFGVYIVFSIFAYSDREDSCRVDVRFFVQQHRHGHKRRRISSSAELFTKQLAHLIFLNPDRKLRLSGTESTPTRQPSHARTRTPVGDASKPPFPPTRVSPSPSPSTSTSTSTSTASLPSSIASLSSQGQPAPSVYKAVLIAFSVQLLIIAFFLLKIFSLESRVSILQADLDSAFELIETLSLQQLSQIKDVLADGLQE